MGLIYSKNIVEVADAAITPRSETTGYSDENVMNFWNLKQRFRANDANTNDYLMKFDFSAAQTLAAIFLNDVNFDKVIIQGHATDSWASPSFASGTITVSQNPVTGRYQVYIPLTAFNYRWMRIFIPTGTAGAGSYTTKWEIGTVCPLSAVTELSMNMSGFTGWPSLASTINTKANGGPDVYEGSTDLQWNANVIFGNRSNSYETELWTMNRIRPSEPMVFYENSGNTSRAYLCHKSEFMQGSISGPNGFIGGTMRLVELM